MEKKELDWGNIGFTYMTTDKRYVAEYKDGAWGEGALTSDPNVVINECAGILQYCQECFEGLKAYTTEDGSIVTFRPDLNAERMMDSAARLEMPPFPKERFLEAVDAVVKANAAWVPPFGSGATLRQSLGNDYTSGSVRLDLSQRIPWRQRIESQSPGNDIY